MVEIPGPRIRTAVAPALCVAVLLSLSCAGARPERSADARVEPLEPPFFVDAAAALGLDKYPARRVALVDVDGDGWLDVFVLDAHKKRPALRLLLSRPRTDGGRTLVDFTRSSGLLAPAGRRFPNFVLFGDVDGDGDMDAFLSRYCDFERPKVEKGKIVRDRDGKPIPALADDGLRCEILLNDGRGVFEALADSGVGEPPATTSAACFVDFDNDGLLDLFVGNWYRAYGVGLEAYPDRLYRGLGGGRFEDVTEKVGMLVSGKPGERDAPRPTYGVTHLDYNNDGWQDLLVCAYGRQWNVLWESKAGKRFEDVARRTHVDGDADTSGVYPEEVKKFWKKRFGHEREDEKPFRSNGNTFDAACEDFDNDGDVDVFLGEICHWWAGSSSDRSMLLENLGRAGNYVFERDATRMERKHPGKRWNEGDLHVGWLDFDNDGLLDLVIASGDYPDGQFLRLFRQGPKGVFTDVTEECGFDWEGCGGVSFGDFDRDGDVDILVGRSFARLPKEKTEGKTPRAALFLNEVGDRNHWLGVFLRGRGAGGSNSFGIGCRVIVKSGDLVQMRELKGGAGHCGHQNPPEALFGLGRRSKVDWVEVRWADAAHTVQRFTDVPVDRYIRIREGSGKVETVAFK